MSDTEFEELDKLLLMDDDVMEQDCLDNMHPTSRLYNFEQRDDEVDIDKKPEDAQEIRTKCVSASKISAIVGLSKYKNPKFYAQHFYYQEPENEYTIGGQIQEPRLRRALLLVTEMRLPMRRCGMFINPSNPIEVATPDDIAHTTLSPETIIEYKYIREPSNEAERPHFEHPGQNTWQMKCFNRGDYAVLIYGLGKHGSIRDIELVCWKVKYSEEYYRWMSERSMEFMLAVDDPENNEVTYSYIYPQLREKYDTWRQGYKIEGFPPLYECERIDPRSLVPFHLRRLCLDMAPLSIAQAPESNEMEVDREEVSMESLGSNAAPPPLVEPSLGMYYAHMPTKAKYRGIAACYAALFILNNHLKRPKSGRRQVSFDCSLPTLFEIAGKGYVDIIESMPGNAHKYMSELPDPSDETPVSNFAKMGFPENVVYTKSYRAMLKLSDLPTLIESGLASNTSIILVYDDYFVCVYKTKNNRCWFYDPNPMSEDRMAYDERDVDSKVIFAVDVPMTELQKRLERLFGVAQLNKLHSEGTLASRSKSTTKDDLEVYVMAISSASAMLMMAEAGNANDFAYDRVPYLTGGLDDHDCDDHGSDDDGDVHTDSSRIGSSIESSSSRSHYHSRSHRSKKVGSNAGIFQGCVDVFGQGSTFLFIYFVWISVACTFFMFLRLMVRGISLF